MTRRHRQTATITLAVVVAVALPACAAMPRPRPDTGYPWHTDIVATTFWVGEVFDPGAPDGSQRVSTYDSDWLGSYGGCDGIEADGECRTEPRTAEADYFPTRMTPRENPFYLDLPFDDLNDETGFATRGEVVPWAADRLYASAVDDPDISLMKNRWVVLHRDGRVCYGQIQDAGPGEYRDAAYVFGDDDRRPTNTRFNGAGLDVSPALNGCLGFADLDGDGDRVDWAFVDDGDVPPGPWTKLVTDSPAR
ncbi:hypothetical protein M3672_10300 [Microbacterium enclense]|uniref:hypothetical protein n=1 Tax=Microbacterium enclense TaxID=993073 RepID=UPI00203D6549|nr:hypothetical protein [Microbacterium enclense]MCM3614825.1 hypothetical protein [Microbacterium enclense]